MLKVIEYTSNYKNLWDGFVTEAKNGCFMFLRDYMGYHSDRFQDNSLLFFDEQDKLVALLPANIRNNALFSHGGLTYGGIISNARMTTPLMIEVFDTLKEYCLKKQIEQLRYKIVPHIYHNIPAEEELYALFINNASLVRRDVSTSIYLPERIKLSKGKKYNISKARKHGLKVEQEWDFKTFMGIETSLLQEKYGVAPTHTTEEIFNLAFRFPDNIKLFAAYLGHQMVSGVIVYESRNVVHTQYIASSDIGKEVGGVDLIIEHLLNNEYKDKRFFDFGISTEQEGRYLNTGLISQKEMFGGRATVYDTYDLSFR